MLYLITYEINTAKDHSALYDAIKSCGAWWHYIDSTWIVKSTKSAKEIQAKLKPHIDDVDDSLLVIKIDPGDRSGWLPQRAWDWIKNNTDAAA